MSNDPRQTDIEEFVHPQDHPAFIGPRLPKSHPQYRAYFERAGRSVNTKVFIERLDKLAAETSKPDPTPEKD